MKFVKKMLATLVACAMAMTLLTACGGAGNGKGNPMLDAVNEILKGNGSEIVLEHSPELNKAVEEVAALEEQEEFCGRGCRLAWSMHRRWLRSPTSMALI